MPRGVPGSVTPGSSTVSKDGKTKYKNSDSVSPHGRLSKYNAERHKIIVDAIRAGNSKATAYRLAGLNEQTPYDWIKAGKDHPERYPEYAKLHADIELAQAEFEASRVAIVKTAADTGTWQAAAWWLERRKPEEWGRNDRVRVDPSERPLVQLNQVVIDDPSIREISRSLLRKLAGNRADVTLGPGAVRELAEDGES